MADLPQELERAVDSVIRRSLGVRPGEHVLVVADLETRRLGNILREAAAAAGADAVVAVMGPRANDGTEPPPTVAAALAAADVFIAPTSRSLSHTRARKAASENGARGATLPGVTEDVLGRLMACDFETLGRRSRALAELLTRESAARITCPLGTRFEFDLTGRNGIADDGDLTSPGAFGNLPCGEGFIAPAGGSGRLVVSSLAGIGLTHGEPAVLTVEDGELTQAEQPEGVKLLERLRSAGSKGTNLAELGIGTNERATLTGNVIEDEKILGTVHVAFGASAGIGGNVSVPIHLDCVVLEPTLEIGTTQVIAAGDFVLGA